MDESNTAPPIDPVAACQEEVRAALERHGCALVADVYPTLRHRPNGQWHLEFETGVRVVRRG